MYVCICRGITDKDLHTAYKAKNGNVKEALKTLGVGSDCGTCLTNAMAEIHQQHGEQMYAPANENSLKKPNA